ncbi:hypothetical protein QF037_001994 [Streptomyces canus]|uniref:hypothetical protein n=1 Tax=Streptomyces canus TaxID=58343 RepID=UPI00277DB126|nr:hypothetical protein [Streptomyces canus]MDQ0597649.1 hypothetical protein [Streptomyces canus]
MSRHSVTARHLRLMLDVVDEARHDASDEFPPPALLSGLGRLVSCDLVEFSEVDLPTRRGLGYQAVQYGGPYPEFGSTSTRTAWTWSAVTGTWRSPS